VPQHIFHQEVSSLQTILDAVSRDLGNQDHKGYKIEKHWKRLQPTYNTQYNTEKDYNQHTTLNTKKTEGGGGGTAPSMEE
jgi:hypothetical protein